MMQIETMSCMSKPQSKCKHSSKLKLYSSEYKAISPPSHTYICSYCGKIGHEALPEGRTHDLKQFRVLFKEFYGEDPYEGIPGLD